MESVDHRETAAYQVTLGSTADQVDCETVVWSFEHAECFSKTEVAQNIEGQLVAPIRYILWRRPGRLPGEFGLRSHFSNLLAESAYLTQDAFLHGPDRRFTEGMAYDC